MCLFVSFLIATICFSRVTLPKEIEAEESNDANTNNSEGAIWDCYVLIFIH